MTAAEAAILATACIMFGLGILAGFAAGLARGRSERPRYRRDGRPE